MSSASADVKLSVNDDATNEDTESSSEMGEEEVTTTDIDELEAQVAARFNACCPFDVRLHRALDPKVDNWNDRCLARAIGMRWKKNSATIYCEWPVGSGDVYPQGDLAYRFLKIYAEASGTFNGEVKRPNAWKELKGCMEHIDEGDDEDSDEVKQK